MQHDILKWRDADDVCPKIEVPINQLLLGQTNVGDGLSFGLLPFNYQYLVYSKLLIRGRSDLLMRRC